MAKAASRVAPSALSLPDTEITDDIDIADDDVDEFRCEEWDAAAELEHVLYENAYRSCDAVRVLRDSWCSGGQRMNRAAAVEIDYAGAARRFCAVTAKLQ
jgi:hypothetical protein